MQSLSTTCVIAGGGPAGMMLGLLLARAGVDVTVLEKHADFLRDFRGDTVHPSTLSVLAEMGLLEEFLALPHARVTKAQIEIGGRAYAFADLSRLPAPCNFIAMVPQWDVLDLLAREARARPNFRLLMQTEAKDLLAKGGRVAGVLAKGPDGNIQIRAGLTVAADGRHSILRARSGLKLREIGAPFDVLWLRLPRAENDPATMVARMGTGQMFVMIPRADGWQCALVIPKGGHDTLRAEGITALRQRLKAVAGFASDRVDTITTFEQIKLLRVEMNRLETWARPGLLCIGDAAHAMSPVGGVGINLAIQDAVAAARILGPVLRRGVPRLSDLRKVQARRQFPTQVMQALQRTVQNRFLAPHSEAKVPLPLRLLDHWPWLQQFPARLIGLGVRREHVLPMK